MDVKRENIVEVHLDFTLKSKVLRDNAGKLLENSQLVV